MRQTIGVGLIALALSQAFGDSADAQSLRFGFCAANTELINYEMERDGLSFQSGGTVTTTGRDGPTPYLNHRFEFHANKDTNRWAFIEIFDRPVRDREDPNMVLDDIVDPDNSAADDVDIDDDEIEYETVTCTITRGRLFVHEGDRETDGTRTHQQSITAWHGEGGDRNVGYVLMAHEGSNRWFLTRHVGGNVTIIMSGTDYDEQLLEPIPQPQRIQYDGGDIFREDNKPQIIDL